MKYRKGTSIRQAPVFRHPRALRTNPWKFIIWMNELIIAYCMLLVSYIQQYFHTSITVLTNQAWKLLIALFKVPNTGAFTVYSSKQSIFQINLEKSMSDNSFLGSCRTAWQKKSSYFFVHHEPLTATLQSTSPKSNLWGPHKSLRLRWNSSYSFVHICMFGIKGNEGWKYHDCIMHGGNEKGTFMTSFWSSWQAGIKGQSNKISQESQLRPFGLRWMI